MRSALIFTIQLLAVLLPVHGSLIGHYTCKTWTMDEGLPLNTVHAMAQTRDGYLWIGTEVGLARFDGIRFEYFNRDNVPVLAHDYILCLHADRQNRLWIGTRGSGIICLQNGRFSTVKAPRGCNCMDVFAILESRDTTIWFGCRHGLYQIEGDKLTTIPVSIPAKASVPYVRALLEDRDGNLWIGTRRGGLFRARRTGSSFDVELQGLFDCIIEALYEDQSGTIWAGTDGNGLFRLTGAKLERVRLGTDRSIDSVYCFREDRHRNLWLGTPGAGLLILSPDRQRLDEFDPGSNLRGTVISRFLEDRERNVWIAGSGGGLIKLREAVIETFTRREGLSNDLITGIFQDSRGVIWAGTRGSGVNFMEGNRFRTLSKAGGFPDDSVPSILEAPPGTLWFATVSSGLIQMKEGRLTAWDTNRGLSDNHVRTLYRDGGGRLWAGTVNGGLHVLERDRLVLVRTLPSRITALLAGRHQTIWAGTMGSGLFRFDPARPDVDLPVPSGLENDLIMYLHEDSDGGIWISVYREGLLHLKEGKPHWLTRREGLPDDNCYCLLEDGRANLWVSSNRGICRIRRPELRDYLAGRTARVNPDVYGRDHGLKSIECVGGVQPNGWKTADGRLLFPTTRGMAVIDPGILPAAAAPPPAIIETILFDGRPVPPADPLIIPPGNGDLEIHFTAPSFLSPEKLRFRYRLDGVDQEWVEAGNNRSARYLDLGPGDYAFRVTAGTPEGIWDSRSAIVAFHWRPAFWQDPVRLFITLFLVMIVTGAALVTRKKILAWRKNQRKLQRLPITADEADRYLQKMMYLLEVEKLYRSPNLSVRSLAAKLTISPRYLSQIINDRLNKNFFDLINSCRIKEAQRILQSPRARNLSILDLSLEIGFNSKSAFNRAFKRYAGATPSQFVKNNRPKT